MAIIKKLSELNESDRTRFGAKAVNLGLLMRLGLEVPPGFAVASEVFADLMSVATGEPGRSLSPVDYLADSDEIIAALNAARLPESILDEIGSRLGGLGGATFVVRSSAGCEDTSAFSMAGVFESYVDLAPAEVPEAVIRCHCSLFSDRALDAYDRAGIDPATVGMGIIVQRFAAGSPSGVLFTADPVRGDDSVIQVSAVDGWCREAVSGSLPKARITLTKATGTTKEAQVPKGAPRPSDDFLAKLVEAVRGIEAALGEPADVEWTTVKGQPVFLQARPLTAMRIHAFPVTWQRSEDALFCWQEPAGPVRPLVAELHHMELLAGNVGAAQSGLSFFHVDATEQNGYLYFRQLDLPDAEARRSAHLQRVRALATEHKNIFTHIYLPQILELQDRAAPVLELAADSPTEDLSQGIDVGVDYLHRVMSFHWLVVHGALYEDTLDRLRDRFGLSSSEANDLLFRPSMLTGKRSAFMEMAQLVRSEPELSTLFSNHSSDRVAYHRLARLSAGSKLLELINRFLATYGLTRREVHLDYRIYSEAPHLILGEVRSLLGLDPIKHAETLRHIADRQAALTAGLTAGLPAKESERIHEELEFLRTSYTVRDDHGHYIDLGAAGYLRFVLLRIGERFAAAGLLNHPGDIGFLRLQEVRDSLDNGATHVPALVARRRELLEEQRRLAAPPWIGAEPPAEAEVPAAEARVSEVEATRGEATTAGVHEPDAPAAAGRGAGGEVRGYSGLATRAVGPVVTANGLDRDPPARFVLVLRHVREIDPSAYPGRVAGIVVEDGSPFDHIGIWARENGIPTLFSAEGITGLVRDGDVLEIDGVNEVARVR